MAMSKKRKRILICIGALIIILPLIAGAILALSLGAIVKTGFETAGPKLLGVETRLNDADISIFRGVIDLHGLKVGNPEGFKAENFLSADRIKVGANIGALFDNEIHVREIILDAPNFSFEYKPGKSNISAIMDRLEQDKKPDQPDDPGQTGKTKDKEEMRLRIDLVKITNATLQVWAAGEQIASIGLPKIEIHNLNGPDGKGLPPDKVLASIIGSVKEPAESLIRSNPATRVAADIASGLATGGKQALDSAGEGAKKIGKGIGGGILDLKKKIVGD